MKLTKLAINSIKEAKNIICYKRGWIKSNSKREVGEEAELTFEVDYSKGIDNLNLIIDTEIINYFSYSIYKDYTKKICLLTVKTIKGSNFGLKGYEYSKI